ncbi:hypothetical protein [Azonexus sp.]|uniref:hypothetical protein n=1 Tax=Azonexus sp. TaxID=1872668 RepID=UPI0027BA5998|nr:hypothetical protein [Azonexus sp.]
MSLLSPEKIEYLAVTAIRAAIYLDACDQGNRNVRLDPACYLACGRALKEIFSVLNPLQHFVVLLQQSPAAREVAESLEIQHRIEISRLGYFPELSIILHRAAV